MSETLEARRARLAALEARDWVYADCTRCGAHGVVAAPGRDVDAMCGPCRLVEASTATTIQRLPAETPVPVVWVPPEDSKPENGSEPVPLAIVCGSRCDHGVPRPVADLKRISVTAGWMTRVEHSRGLRAGARVVADQWSVRFRRDAWQGYAVRSGGSWESVCVTGAALPPFLALGVTDLRKWLAEPDRPDEWYAEIVKRVADQALASKIVKCPGPGGCAWVDEGRGDHTHRANGEIKIKKSKGEPRAGL